MQKFFNHTCRRTLETSSKQYKNARENCGSFFRNRSSNKSDITDIAVLFQDVCIYFDKIVEQWKMQHRLEIEEKSSSDY